MDGDVMGSRSENRSVFATRNILRILVVLMLVFAFCPSFLVSCSDIDEEFRISAWTAVNGLSTDSGSEVMEPQPRIIFCFLLPMAAGVLLCVKALGGRVCAGGVLGCTAVDMLLWFHFQETAKNIAEENLCQFETLGYFYANIAVMCTVIVLTLLVLVGVVSLDRNTINVYGGDTRAPVDTKTSRPKVAEPIKVVEEDRLAEDTGGRLKIRMPGYSEDEMKYFKQATNLNGTPIEEKER